MTSERRRADETETASDRANLSIVGVSEDVSGSSNGGTPPPREDGRIVTPESIGFRPHNCFACGQLNVSGLQLQLHLDPSQCWAETTLPSRFEGWEGIAHGGILCAILDEVMAWSLIEHDNWGVTARMDVQFRRPVEIGRPIRAEGWITEVKRRTQRTAGRVIDAETGLELATAEALYVAAPAEKKEELKRRYGYRADLLRGSAADSEHEGGRAQASEPPAAPATRDGDRR